MTTSDFEAQLAALKQRYLDSLPSKLDELRAARRAYLAAPTDRQRLQNWRILTHRLAGSGATYGYAGLSQQARGLDTILKSLLGTADVESTPQSDEPDAEQVRTLDTLAASLEAMIESVINPD